MERKEIVLDASVVVKWFTQEEGRDKAIILRDKFVNREINILCPDLILYELSNALRYNPNFDVDDVKLAINSILEMDLNIIVPLSSTINRAIELSFEKDITLYDAFYIALAFDLDFVFITADKKLYNKAKDLGFVELL